MKTALILFALVVVVYSAEYNINVKLGSKSFDKIEDASLKIIIGGKGESETYRIKRA